jgi:hypothetical protein
MLGLFWTMVAISTVMLSLRFHVRLKINSIGWDDWMMLLTWVCSPNWLCTVET